MKMDNLIGRRFHVPTRNETNGTRGVYQGMILEEMNEGQLLVELISPEGQRYVTLMPTASFLEGKPAPAVWATPLKKTT